MVQDEALCFGKCIQEEVLKSNDYCRQFLLTPLDQKSLTVECTTLLERFAILSLTLSVFFFFLLRNGVIFQNQLGCRLKYTFLGFHRYFYNISLLPAFVLPRVIS